VGVYRRADSPYWHLWLEKAPKGQQRVRTDIVIGVTKTERAASREAALAVYHTRMLAAGRVSHGLDSGRPTIRFAAYAATYLRDVISHHKGHVREAEIVTVLNRGLGGLWLHEIDRDAVAAWMTTRRQTVCANTVNREVGLLKSMLRDAAPKYIPASPIAGMKLLPTVQHRRRLLQWDEEARLLMACDDVQELGLLVLGLDTLQRMGDLLDLQRSHRKGGWIYIVDSKNGTAADVPLSPRSARVLDAITHPSPYYFEKFRQAKNPRDWRGSVRQRLEKISKRAGVPFGKAEAGIVFHGATRKTGATKLLVEKHVPVSVVQRIGLWKSPDVMLRIYAEAQRDDLASAVGQVSQPSGVRDTGTARKR
jgi:integrase